MSDSTSDKPAATGTPATAAGLAATAGPTAANGPAGEHLAGPAGAQPPDLTAEEEAKPYSKYYHGALATPDTALMAQLRPDKPLDPAEVLLPESMNDLLEPGYLPGETGWCVMPNGAGYVAVNNKMPGVTAEMVDWWMWWHSLEDLRYKIWWPPAHAGISPNDERDRKRVLDPDPGLPDTARWQGVTHHVVENIGGGFDDIYISFLTPEQFGFDMSRFHKPNVSTAVCANGANAPVGSPPFVPKATAMMCHFVRDIPGGIEYRTRFWLGYQVVEKRPVCILPPGAKVPWQAPFGLAVHNVQEYSNLRAFLPKIYAEQRDKDPLG